MDNLDYDEVTWYLVFTSPDARKWWMNWLRPGYEHVWALRYDGEHFIAFSPMQGFTDIDVVDDGWLTGGTTVLKVTSDRVKHRIRMPWPLVPFTCVEQVKALLGIRHWCITPWQLHRAITMDNIKGVIADGVAEGMKTAHLNKTPSEVDDEHPDIEGLSLKSLANVLKED